MYIEEKNIQMIISLMKQYGIRKVIACPGAGNASMVYSLQTDNYFEMKSVLDERSALYMAIGWSQCSGEAIAVVVTNNVAIRNTVPGMTEAFYRKIPILLLSSSFHFMNQGNDWPQVINEKQQMLDVARKTVLIPEINNEEQEWLCNVELNRVFTALFVEGGGPVHVHYEARFSKNYNSGIIQNKYRKIEWYNSESTVFPPLGDGKIVVYVGNHLPFEEKVIAFIEDFCEKNEAIVFCDNTSNYYGKYRINPAVVWNQNRKNNKLREIDLVIQIGNVSGSYIVVKPQRVWRVSEDGLIKDSFMKLDSVFMMKEETFFAKYTKCGEKKEKNVYYSRWQQEIENTRKNINELPFSNAWIAQHYEKSFKPGTAVYFAILNTLRCWNLFDLPKGVYGFCNTGAFGIDGGVSTLMGMSFSNPDKLYWGIFGDLGFFFDINATANRHIGKNVRIIVINNGMGVEFRNYKHFADELGEAVNEYIAAAGHNGNKSEKVLKHFAEDMGYKYYSARSKEEFAEAALDFFDTSNMEKSIILEVFVNQEDEKEALRLIYTANGEE